MPPLLDRSWSGSSPVIADTRDPKHCSKRAHLNHEAISDEFEENKNNHSPPKEHAYGAANINVCIHITAFRESFKLGFLISSIFKVGATEVSP